LVQAKKKIGSKKYGKHLFEITKICVLLSWFLKTGGFFIECGALDGETGSNTLYLERFLGWRGLLVEANPSNVEMLKKINRKAWLVPTCLSIKPYPVQVKTDFIKLSCLYHSKNKFACNQFLFLST
jgi:hypothetical protein